MKEQCPIELPGPPTAPVNVGLLNRVLRKAKRLHIDPMERRTRNMVPFSIWVAVAGIALTLLTQTVYIVKYFAELGVMLRVQTEEVIRIRILIAETSKELDRRIDSLMQRQQAVESERSVRRLEIDRRIDQLEKRPLKNRVDR